MEIPETKFRYKCPKHPDLKIEFLSVDNLETNQEYNNLFYCSDCISDSTSKQQNYLSIKKIIKSGTDQIIPKWPPISDYKLINQLIKLATGNEEIELIIAQIEEYFTDLKEDILKQIDICQKKMIQCAQELPLNKTQILSQYQELSQVKELRSVLVDQETDIHKKERQCRIMIEKIISEKQSINEQLIYLLNQHKQQQISFNQKSALLMKDSILKSISNINLFENYITPIDNFQLVKTDFNGGQNTTTEITKNENNQYQVLIKQQKNWQNIVSNILLENNKKYIFRLEIQLPLDKRFMIGLMKDTDINNNYGYENRLSCFLLNINQQISKYPDQNYGIDKLIKGDDFKLSESNDIEMRVCLEDQILELLDYPYYLSKLALQDQYKNNLKNLNLRLYLGMLELDNKIILKEAFTVKQFE